MSDINPNELPPLDTTALEQELRAEAQYGGKPLEAAAGSAASMATFGLSDAALVEAGVDPERLREVRDREATASMIGSGVGIVAPALATLGGSAGAQAASAGVRAATAVGRAAEAAAVKALAPKLGATAANIAGKTVAGAAEGALAGTGQLVSDVALERKDLSAESTLATVGAGTLIGGVFGATIGTAQAAFSPVAKKITSMGSSAKNLAKEAVEDLTDPVEASLRVTAFSSAQRAKLRDSLGDNIETLPTFLKQNLELEMLSTPSQLLAKNTQVIDDAGKQIGAISKRLDELTAGGEVAVSRAEAYSPLLKRIDDEIANLGAVGDITTGDRRILNRYRNHIISLGSSEAPFSFTEFNKFRKKLQDNSKFRIGVDRLESFEANVANALRAEARGVVDSIAGQASAVEPALAAGLKEANKTFSMGATLEPFLEQLAERQAGFTAPVEFITSTAGRSARNLAVITDVAEKTAQVQKAITGSVSKFFTGVASKAPKASTALSSTQALMGSGFSLDTKQNKPAKTKEQAFKNISSNLLDLQNNPEKLVDLVAKKTARISNADAGVAAAMQSNLATAVSFLAEKLPKSGAQSGLFVREYTPSSLELSKFERYLQVVEKPLTVLADLERGTLTREHVEALKAVYPEIYKEVQQTAMDYVVQAPKLSYDKKIQLGILLDIPADSSLAPQNLLGLQANFQTEESEPTVTGTGNVDVAGRMESGTEKVANS